ncbi:hypothetical protein CYMTET_24726, partial [Cymbomonas tetramitiformis]
EVRTVCISAYRMWRWIQAVFSVERVGRAACTLALSDENTESTEKLLQQFEEQKAKYNTDVQKRVPTVEIKSAAANGKPSKSETKGTAKDGATAAQKEMVQETSLQAAQTGATGDTKIALRCRTKSVDSPERVRERAGSGGTPGSSSSNSTAVGSPLGTPGRTPVKRRSTVTGASTPQSPGSTGKPVRSRASTVGNTPKKKKSSITAIDSLVAVHSTGIGRRKSDGLRKATVESSESAAPSPDAEAAEACVPAPEAGQGGKEQKMESEPSKPMEGSISSLPEGYEEAKRVRFSVPAVGPEDDEHFAELEAELEAKQQALHLQRVDTTEELLEDAAHADDSLAALLVDSDSDSNGTGPRLSYDADGDERNASADYHEFVKETAALSPNPDAANPLQALGTSDGADSPIGVGTRSFTPAGMRSEEHQHGRAETSTAQPKAELSTREIVEPPPAHGDAGSPVAALGKLPYAKKKKSFFKTIWSATTSFAKSSKETQPSPETRPSAASRAYRADQHARVASE